MCELHLFTISAELPLLFGGNRGSTECFAVGNLVITDLPFLGGSTLGGRGGSECQGQGFNFHCVTATVENEPRFEGKIEGKAPKA